MSLGFGSETMQNLDIVSFERVDQSILTIHDRYSNAYDFPLEDIDLGGISNYILLGYYLENNLIKVKFKRKLDTGDSYDA